MDLGRRMFLEMAFSNPNTAGFLHSRHLAVEVYEGIKK
jgi:hypothetical protein